MSLIGTSRISSIVRNSELRKLTSVLFPTILRSLRCISGENGLLNTEACNIKTLQQSCVIRAGALVFLFFFFESICPSSFLRVHVAMSSLNSKPLSNYEHLQQRFAAKGRQVDRLESTPYR